MKITILNESFISNDNLKRLKALGKVEVFLDTANEDTAIDRINDSEIVIADMFVCPINKKVLSKAEKLKLIVLNTTGYDKVDLDYAKSRGIKVCNAPGFATDAVAEHAFSLMMSVARKVVFGDKSFRAKPFEILPDDDCHRIFMGLNLKGKTLGVIGTGNIGRRVCEIGVGLGMKVIAHNRTEKKITGVTFKELSSVLTESDVISLNLPLTKESEGLIDKEKLNMMKKDAILINTSRDKIVNTDALYDSLFSGKLFGVGLDVVALDDKNHPILKLENVIFTPHSAWFTKESLDNLGEIIVDNVESFVKGNEKNIIN